MTKAEGISYKLVFFYDRIINLVFHVSLLQELVEKMIPSGFPIWVLF